MAPAESTTPSLAHRVAAIALMVAGATAVAGCPKTEFYDEGRGQPTDRALGKAPPGTIGACRVPRTMRPPVVNPELWENLETCNKRTPYRYLRVGYEGTPAANDAGTRRMQTIMTAVEEAASQADGNLRMINTLREVQRVAAEDPRLQGRVERSTSRTFACDYTYLFETTSNAYEKVSATPDPCTAYAYDPKKRRDVCLFDVSVPQAKWLTGSWSCLAFTATAGEGASCYQLCNFDDHCLGQVSCAEPDFNLLMCAIGVCMPEDGAGFY